jgi:hypothetical protein
MYKTYNFEPKFLSPQQKFNNSALQKIAERLVPFLIIAATFVWLWK